MTELIFILSGKSLYTLWETLNIAQMNDSIIEKGGITI